MKQHLIALCCVLVIAGTSPAGEPVKKPIRVPFELLPSRHMAVKVMINGKGPFRLIFDTGAPVTLVNNKLAKAANVFPKNYRKPFFALFGSAGQFKLKLLELGAVKAKDVPVTVMDHPTVSLMSKIMGPLDGIVGLSFFGRYRMTVDYQKREMTFAPNNYKPPDIMKRLVAAYAKRGLDATKKILRPGGILGLQVSKEKDDERPGATISKVVPKSAAAKAGLKKGDRLLVLDDYWTDSVLDCYSAARTLQPGKNVRVTIERDGKRRVLTVRVQAGL